MKLLLPEVVSMGAIRGHDSGQLRCTGIAYFSKGSRVWNRMSREDALNWGNLPITVNCAEYNEQIFGTVKTPRKPEARSTTFVSVKSRKTNDVDTDVISKINQIFPKWRKPKGETYPIWPRSKWLCSCHTWPKQRAVLPAAMVTISVIVISFNIKEKTNAFVASWTSWTKIQEEEREKLPSL